MPYNDVFMRVVKIYTIRQVTTDKVGTINVLTFHGKPAIINKSPRGKALSSKTGEAAYKVKDRSGDEKKITKNFRKGIDKRELM